MVWRQMSIDVAVYSICLYCCSFQMEKLGRVPTHHPHSDAIPSNQSTTRRKKKLTRLTNRWRGIAGHDRANKPHWPALRQTSAFHMGGTLTSHPSRFSFNKPESMLPLLARRRWPCHFPHISPFTSWTSKAYLHLLLLWTHSGSYLAPPALVLRALRPCISFISSSHFELVV